MCNYSILHVYFQQLSLIYRVKRKGGHTGRIRTHRKGDGGWGAEGAGAPRPPSNLVA